MNYENIPSELKAVPQWVCWKFQERIDAKTGEIKKTKVPKSAFGKGNAQSNNPKTWGSFQQAWANADKNKFDGIGFMFAPPYFGVDLDKCIENKAFVDEFVEGLNSYTEYSVSKTGVHIICKGKLPDGARRKGIVEMYENGRFFIMTGNVYGDLKPIVDCTETIKPLHAKHLAKKEVQKKSYNANHYLSENDILKVAFASKKNGYHIQKLYSGDFSDYPSQSEADLALCNHLAFYSQGDYGTIDKLFRQSGLMRDKWDEMRGAVAYSQKVINSAIDGCSDFYKPSRETFIEQKSNIDILEIREFPFSDEVYLFVINEPSEVNKIKYKQHLAKVATEKKAYKQFDQLYKAFEKDNPKATDDDNKVTNFKIDKELYCGHWVADMNGIRTFNASGQVLACNTPIYPVKILENIQTQEEKVKISFFNKTHWKELFIEKETLLVASKITVLTRYGVLVTSEWAKNLSNYFAQVFAKNDFPKYPSTSKMGWAEEYKAFLPLTESSLELDTQIGLTRLVASLDATGDKDKYIEFIKNILQSERKETKIAIYASLASVLIEPLGLLSFIVHIYGQAGIGKTLITKLCAGIWGNPVENGFLQDPKNSKTSFEIILNLLHNLPFIADDINKLSSDPFFKPSDLIYLLGGGSGKGRGNIDMSLRVTGTWRNVSILNGERALTSELSHGGELLRTIELQLEPKAIFEDGSGTAEFLHNNYGFLGKMFVDFLIQYEHINQAKELKKYFSEEIKRLYGNQKEGKQIESVGVLYATQYLLCSMLKIEQSLTIEDFAHLIKNIDDVLDTQRAYENICNIILQNSSSFLLKDKILEHGEKEPNVKWGWFDKNDYYIIPTQFTKICKDVNMDKRLFIEWAVEKGLIDAQKGRKDGTKVIFIKEQQKSIRVCKLNICNESD